MCLLHPLPVDEALLLCSELCSQCPGLCPGEANKNLLTEAGAAALWCMPHPPGLWEAQFQASFKNKTELVEGMYCWTRGTEVACPASGVSVVAKGHFLHPILGQI